ncbi:MASE1 domain-containing protein [Oculatella sp. LEGE 06141]|uniref:PAS domain S-box protein n=1 Tax=Oculatella sp. LEGE 06141 TaxID=1828648 RepID=UPI00188080FC|nr:PAS domain S-box protein [Oculatella sp. LEGE 06141]MBE9180822.1 MASE1 domain-containing protein [Oculatella sp. LEGE 06141]
MIYPNSSASSLSSQPVKVESPPLLRSPKAIIGLVGLAIVYFMLARLTLSVLHSNELISPVWSPAGFNLGILLLIGRLGLPIVGLSSAGFVLSLGLPWSVAVGMTVGITLQALAAATLLRRTRFNVQLSQVRDVGGLVLFGGLFSTPIAPVVGFISLWLGGVYTWNQFPELVGEWWLSDAISVLVVTPVLLSWFMPLPQGKPVDDTIPRLQRVVEIVLWFLLLITLSWLGFICSCYPGSTLYPIEYLPFPLVIWAALRLGQRGTTLSNLMIAAIAAWGATQGSSLSWASGELRSIVFLQAFLGVITVTGLLLAATVSERQQAIDQLQVLADDLDRQVVERSEQLKASEARASQLIESNLIGIVFWDGQGNILEANQAFCTLIGYSCDEVMRGEVNWLEVVPPERRYLDQQWLREMRHAEQHSPLETEYIRKDGQRVPALVGATFLEGSDNFGFSFVLDLTEYKRTRTALEESEKRFRRLVESNMFGVVFGNFNDGIRYANDYFLQMMHYSKDELLSGKIQWKQLTPSEFQNSDARSAKELKTLGVCTPIEKNYTRDDGSQIPVLIGGALLQEPYDQQQELIAFYLDLSERKRTEEALRLLAEVGTVLTTSLDYKNTLKRIARLAVPGLADYCLIFTVEESNSIRCLAATHVLPECETLLHQLEPLGPAPLEDTNPLIMKVMRSGRSRFIPEVARLPIPELMHTEQLVTAQPELWPTSLMLVPLTARGRTLGVLVLATTESKRHYEPIDLALAEDVARRVGMAMDNARLYRQAQEVNRIKDEFLATLSHELRSPLNGILGWAQLLRRRQFDQATAAQGLETIERNAKAQVQLIDDLLDISRIIRGKLRLNVRPMDLPPVIEAAIEAMRPAADAKGILLQSRLDSTAGPVSGDPDRLQQMLWNLLSNAIKFTPQGGRVEVRLSRTSRYAEIAVIDTGRGINPEFLPYVFERFRQADGSITRSHGGLGLGLAIVRHLTELHGGMVQAVSSGEGEGATFTVKLPLMAVVQETHQTLEPSQTAYNSEIPSVCSPSLDGVRVLVVDDELDARDLVSAILEDCGANVATVASTQEAIAILHDFSPHVLVSDIGMPNEDGYSLIRQIRSRQPDQYSKIPAVALTAYARQEDRRQALLAGFQTHIPKPVNPTELIVVVGTLAGRD